MAILSPFALYPVTRNGEPLSGAKLLTYEAGTTTPLATYTDDALTTPATNPLVADADGRIPAHFLLRQAYKFVLTDADDVAIFTVDNVDPTGAASSAATLAELTGLDTSSYSDGDVVQVNGYAASGDGGERFVRWDASSTDSADGVTVFVPDAGGTGRWKHLGAVYPEHAGAFESAADNATALQRLFTADLSFDGRERTYKVNSQLNYNSDASMTWRDITLSSVDGSDTQIVVYGAGDDFTIPSANSGALQSVASNGDRSLSLTVSDAAEFASGDIGLLYEDALWNAEHARKSEFVWIDSVSSGTVNIRGAIKGAYSTSATLRKWNSQLSPTCRNVTIIGKGGSSTQSGIVMHLPYRAHFHEMEFQDLRRRSLWLNVQVECTASGDNRAYNSDESGLGYGIAVSGGQGGSFGEWTGNRCRHLKTTGDSGTAPGANTPNFILLRELAFGHKHCDNATGEIDDTHGGVVDEVNAGVTGSMATGFDTPAVIDQGARITRGDVNVAGAGLAPVRIQALGCGDPDRPDFFKFGNVAASSDSADVEADDRVIALIEIETGGVDVDSIKFASITGIGNGGVIIRAKQGNIRHVDLGAGGWLRATEGNAIDVTDYEYDPGSGTQRYAVRRVTANGYDLRSLAASGAYPVRARASATRTVSVTEAIGTISLTDCILTNESADICVRDDGYIIETRGCEFETNDVGAIYFGEGDHSAFILDGDGFQNLTIASGVLSGILPGATIAVSPESSTSDAIDTATLSNFRFRQNGTGADMNNLPNTTCHFYITPASSGDTITINHASSGAGSFKTLTGSNTALSYGDIAMVRYLPAGEQFHVLLTS